MRLHGGCIVGVRGSRAWSPSSTLLSTLKWRHWIRVVGPALMLASAHTPFLFVHYMHAPTCATLAPHPIVSTRNWTPTIASCNMYGGRAPWKPCCHHGIPLTSSLATLIATHHRAPPSSCPHLPYLIFLLRNQMSSCPHCALTLVKHVVWIICLWS